MIATRSLSRWIQILRFPWTSKSEVQKAQRPAKSARRTGVLDQWQRLLETQANLVIGNYDE